MKKKIQAIAAFIVGATCLCGAAACGSADEKPTSESPYVRGPAPDNDGFTPVFRFVVASDMHLSATNPDTSMNAGRFRDMFVQMNEYAAAQEYDGLDAILLAGDISDGGTPADLALAKSIIDSNLKESTELVITMGNHDFWGNKSNPTAMIGQFESYFGDVNSHKVIGGYHFITLCADKDRAGDPGWNYSESVAEYAKTELAAAYEAVGRDQPIFVLQHVGNLNTCGGTCEHTSGGGVSTLDSLYKQYPNVVCFAGHSHFACNDECSIHQRDYTSIATGGLYYSTRTMLGGNYLPMQNMNQMAQNYVIEIDKNHAARIRCWDILQKKFVGETWSIDSWKKEDFIYTEDRFLEGDLFFAEDTKINVGEIGAYEAEISFNPVPEDSLTARIYKVTVKDEAQKVVCERYLSRDYFNEPKDPLSTIVSGLKPQTSYSVEAVALNSLYCSELNRADTSVEGRLPVMHSQTIQARFTTTSKPEKPADEVLAFNDADDLTEIAATGALLSWEESANGVNGGVLKVKHENSAHPILQADLTKLCKNYKEYDWLVVRAYFSNKLSGSMQDMNLNGKDDDYFKSWIYHNAWKNYVFNISSLTEAQVSALQLQFTTTKEITAAGEFWIDEIYLMKHASKSDILVGLTGEKTEGEEISFKLINPSNAKIKQFIVKDPEGVTVENPEKTIAKYGKYIATVTLVSGNQSDDTRNALYYGGRNTEFTFSFTVAEAPKVLEMQFEEHETEKKDGQIVVTLPQYTIKKNGAPFKPDSVVASIGIKNVKHDEISAEDGKFIAPLDGAVYEVVFAVKTGAKIERFTYEITLNRPEEQAAHEIFDCEYAVDLENFYTDENSVASYVQNTGFMKVGNGSGENIPVTGGMIRVDYSGTESPWFSFKPAHDMQAYADYDYFIMQIWCVDGANKIISVQPGAGSDCTHFGNGDHKTAWTDTSAYYFTYAFKIKPFSDAWTDGALDTNVAKVQLKIKGNGAGTYYIADIYAAKDISDCSLSVTVNGEEYAGGKTVSAGAEIVMHNPENFRDIEMLVDGESVTRFIAEAGKTYTITFRHINRVDNDYYHLRYNYGACYSAGGATKTITLAVAA